MSGPSAHERVKKLEARGVIRATRRSSIPRAIGYDILAFSWITQAPGTAATRPDRGLRRDPRDRGVPPHHRRGRLPDQGPGPRHPRPRAGPPPGPGDAPRLPDRDRRRVLERIRAAAVAACPLKPTSRRRRNDGRGPSGRADDAALVREVAAGSQDALAAIYDRSRRRGLRGGEPADMRIGRSPRRSCRKRSSPSGTGPSSSTRRSGRSRRGFTRSPATGPSIGSGPRVGDQASSRSPRPRAARTSTTRRRSSGSSPRHGPRRGGPRSGPRGRARGDRAARR